MANTILSSTSSVEQTGVTFNSPTDDDVSDRFICEIIMGKNKRPLVKKQSKTNQGTKQQPKKTPQTPETPEPTKIESPAPKGDKQPKPPGN